MANKREINSLCDSANTNFKIAFNKENKKFNYGHKWLKFKSNIFIDESNKSYPKSYTRYKRGTILYVDFGVNIGGEFCGRHFAISLDKDDSSYKSTTTVIPLTSKGGKGKIRLGKALIEPYKEKINENLQVLIEINQELDKDRQEVILTIPKLIKAITDIKKKDNSDGSIAINEMVPILIKAGVNLDKEIPYTESQLWEEFDFYSKQLESKPKKYQDKIDRLHAEMKQLELILKQLEKLNVDSYALSDHIYTISKQKIIKRNKYDPTGEITIEPSLLKLLSDNLARKFTLA